MPRPGWVLAEEYLSGYVKDKLAQAVLAEEEYPEWLGGTWRH